jgi:hypothetical protein
MSGMDWFITGGIVLLIIGASIAFVIALMCSAIGQDVNRGRWDH